MEKWLKNVMFNPKLQTFIQIKHPHGTILSHIYLEVKLVAQLRTGSLPLALADRSCEPRDLGEIEN